MKARNAYVETMRCEAENCAGDLPTVEVHARIHTNTGRIVSVDVGLIEGRLAEAVRDATTLADKDGVRPEVAG